MKQFMDADFLLESQAAKDMFAAANQMPIFDWHCHLSPKEIYENAQPGNIAQLWLGGDHYKWRAMRSCGVEEKYITGDASWEEKFKAFATCMPSLIGNPIYHWTHLELQRYFEIYEPLSGKNWEKIWNAANAKIAAGGFTPRELILKSNVACLCTTDDPADSLEYHALIAKDNFACKVLPAFRPDKALGIELPGFCDWVKAMEQTAGKAIDSYQTLKDVLLTRIDFFDKMGCRASDHAFAYVPCVEASEEALEAIFQKRMSGAALTVEEQDAYKTQLLWFMAAEYAKRGWVMELHMGPMRNNNARMFQSIGPDTGFDSIDDQQIARPLSRFLDHLDAQNALPRTVLFTLNPKDNYVLGSMLGNFQTAEAAGKIQFGSGWWFNDHIDGMTQQMRDLGNLGVLSKFVGMVTDSRSFLSYPRHEYFRRIFCNLCGDLVERGLYPYDKEALETIAQDVAFNNAKAYFGLVD